jgi:membrane protease YdiL (CAAX protease family)
METQYHSLGRSIFLHLYPGILITIFFILITPTVIAGGYPPQFSMLLAVCFIALPLLGIHLFLIRKQMAHQEMWMDSAPKMSSSRYALFVGGLVSWAFLIWVLTTPLISWLTTHVFAWLPSWYTTQAFTGYSRQALMATLVLNLFANGILAPIAEELYFRAYLLPRIGYLKNYAPVANTALFSLYHFWQPYLYPTLFLALLPMVYLIWRRQNVRIGIYTHCLLNLIGALLAFLQLPK